MAKASKAAKPQGREVVAGLSGRAPNKEGLAYKVRLELVKDPALDFEDLVKRLSVTKPHRAHCMNLFVHARGTLWTALAEGWKAK